MDGTNVIAIENTNENTTENTKEDIMEGFKENSRRDTLANDLDMVEQILTAHARGNLIEIDSSGSVENYLTRPMEQIPALRSWARNMP